MGLNINGPLAINLGSLTLTPGTVVEIGTSNTISGTVSITGTPTVSVAPPTSGTLTLVSAITSITNPVTIEIGTSNDFTLASTTLSGGTLTTLPNITVGAGTLGLLNAGTITTVGAILAGSVALTGGTITTMPNLTIGGGTIGLIQAGTITSMPNITIGAGTLGLLNAGTLTTLGAILAGSVTLVGGTLTNLPNLTIGGGTIGLLQAGTITSMPNVTIAGGTIGLLQAGTITTMPNITVGSGTLGLLQAGTITTVGALLAGSVTLTGQPTVTPNMEMASGTNSTPTLFAVINATASGDNQIVAAVAGKKIRVTDVLIVPPPGGTVTLAWRSSTTPISGTMSLTTGYALPTFRGMFETVAGQALNLNLGSAVSVQGHLTYVTI